MGQSLAKQFVHVVFSTKYREPFIFPPVENELHQYLGGTCKALDCDPVIVGGFVDHIHILCQQSKNISTATLLEKVKSCSSKWIKTKGEEFANFQWQRGYASFTVDPRTLESVKTYIQNQKEHHGIQNFQNELSHFLRVHQLEFDERYLWD